MTKGFSTDDAKWVLQRTDEWIRSADAKAGAVAAIRKMKRAEKEKAKSKQKKEES